jgi:hypothetical protein
MTTTRTSTPRGRAPRASQPMSATKREALATQQLLSTLGADKRAAVTAALEVINERLAWDLGLRQSLSQKYAEIAALAKPTSTADRGPAPTPKPASGLARHSPLTKTNPYELADEWGRDHLRALLEGASQKLLREAVTVVQARAPGTKPVSRSKNADMVDYIMEHVAGPGY